MRFSEMNFVNYGLDGEPKGDPVPKEIWDYYMAHPDEYKDIPLNTATAYKIAKILDNINNEQ